MAGKCDVTGDKVPSVRSTKNIDANIGQRIRKRRRMLRLSQGKLAALAGITPQQIQKYETGSNRIAVSRLVELAKILSVPITWFFEEACPSPEPVGDAPRVSDLDTLCRLFLLIDDERQRAALLTIAAAFVRAGGHDT